MALDAEKNASKVAFAVFLKGGVPCAKKVRNRVLLRNGQRPDHPASATSL
jgi:hypothetical protein